MFDRKINFFQQLKSLLFFWFSFIDVDDHYVIKIFGIKICKKHKTEISINEITHYSLTTEKRNPKVIVSLTTFPGRIDTVYKTISTLMNQTVKADEIVLWLADEQFPEHKLPESLIRLQEFGLSIKWCENIMSFKKLVPSLREFPKDIIITADDDIFYPENYIENLYNAYLNNPNVIHANRAFVIKEKNGRLSINARSYVYDSTYLAKYTNEFMTGYGTLFPPESLHKDVLDSSVFMEIIPTNDDCWFWSMAVRNNKRIQVNPEGYKLKLMIDRTVQDTALWKLNMKHSIIGMNGNDAVNMLFERYPEIKKNLKEDL